MRFLSKYQLSANLLVEKIYLRKINAHMDVSIKSTNWHQLSLEPFPSTGGSEYYIDLCIPELV